MATFQPTHGSIVHVELYSDDPAATSAFYEEVFGWTFEAVEGMDYTMYRAPSPPHGGLLAREEGDFQPPSTFVYLDVEDVVATSEAIIAAGGDLLVDEIEVPGMGVFAVFEAPGGVVQAAWEDRYEGEPPEGGWDLPTDEPEPGSLVHVELYTEDPDATRAFYEGIFDWTFETVGEGEYTVARPPTPPYGGLMESSEHMEPGTLGYLLVADASAACEAIEAAGGDVVREPFEIEGWGTMAVFEAPGAGVQALWESSEG